MRRAMVAGAVACLVAGCAQTGDFGRKQPSVMNDDVLPAAGTIAARLREEPVSAFMLTDAERDLRDRAYLFLMPAHPRARFDAMVVELARTRVLPRHLAALAPPVYFEALMREPWHSSRSPYRQLVNDIEADIALLDPLRASAETVRQRDGVRLNASLRIADLREDEIANAGARVAENTMLMEWIDDAVGRRADAYGYALERLLVELPEVDAIAAERGLARLKSSMSGAPAATVPAQRRTAPVNGGGGRWHPWPRDREPAQK